jgi:hypothetical protein
MSLIDCGSGVTKEIKKEGNGPQLLKGACGLDFLSGIIFSGISICCVQARSTLPR